MTQGSMRHAQKPTNRAIVKKTVMKCTRIARGLVDFVQEKDNVRYPREETRKIVIYLCRAENFIFVDFLAGNVHRNDFNPGFYAF